MHKIKIITILLSASALLFAGNHSWKLLSPDKNIIMTIEQDSANQSLSYHVDIMSNTLVNVIGNSTLGTERNDQDFINNLEFVQQSEVKTIDETYQMMIGRQSGFRNFANETSLTFKTKKGALLQIDCRVYNDGIAFRYVFPERGSLSTSDETSFWVASGEENVCASPLKNPNPLAIRSAGSGGGTAR